MSNVQLMDMGNLDIRLKNVRPSVGLTERGKKVARTKAQTAYNGQVYTEVNYFIKVNVDAFETKKNEIHIQNIKLSQENGEDILIQDYLAIIYPPQKNKLTKILRKVGAIMWPRICMGSQAEKTVSRIYQFVIIFFGIFVLISGASLLGANFIPKPIDKAIFWPSLAGGLGFYIDYVKRGLNNDRQ